MKNRHSLRIILVFVTMVFTLSAGYAQQTLYWVGPGTVPLNWNASAANWSANSGGLGGAGIPGTTDTMIFDGASGFNADCVLSSAVNVAALKITGTYMGIVFQSAALTVTGKLTIDAGTFSGASMPISLGGFSQNGGVFKATTGTTKITGNTDFTSGTFNPNGGTIDFHITASGPAITITGSPTLNHIAFSSQSYSFFHTVSNNPVANNVTIDLSVGCYIQLAVTNSLTAKGNLTFTSGIGNHQITGGKIFVEKNLVLNSPAANTNHPLNAITIELNGSTDQDIVSTVAAGFNVLPSIRINKPSGTTLNLSGTITVAGPNWTYVSGTINPGTSTVYFYQPSGGPLITVSGNHTLGDVIILLDYSYSGLTVVNNLAVDNLTLNSSTGVKIVLTGTVTVNHLLKLTGSGSNIVMNGGTIYAKGDIDLSATYTTIDAINTSTIEINGTGDQKLTGPVGLGQCVLPNITINKTGGLLTLFNKITLQGSWNYIQGDVDASTNASTVFFTQYSSTVIPVIDGQGTAATMAFHHLRMSNPYPASLLIAGALDVNGDLRVAANTTLNNTGSFPINIAGDFNSAGTFNPGNATVTFDGTVDQNVTSSGSIINKLVIDKTTGNVVLLAPLQVKASGQLVLTSGNLNTGAGAALTMNNGATTLPTLGRAISYVDGPLLYVVALNGLRTLNLPLGAGGAWRPAELNVQHNTATAYTYKSELKNASAHALGYTLPASLQYVSGKRYLQVDSNVPAATLVAGTVKLYFDTDDEVTNMAKLGVAAAQSIAPANPTAWTDISGGSSLGSGGPTYLNGYIASLSFAPVPGAPARAFFALANRTAGVGTNNPLPIELSSFTVTANNSYALLSWETKSEKNNDYFAVERSAEGKEFELLTHITGAGTLTASSSYSWRDKQPLPEYSYYRLRQVDFDGNFTFSNVVRFHNNGTDETPLVIYPLPVKDRYIYFSRIASVRIVNANGSTISTFENVEAVDVSGLEPGLYIIKDHLGKSHKMTIIR